MKKSIVGIHFRAFSISAAQAAPVKLTHLCATLMEQQAFLQHI